MTRWLAALLLALMLPALAAAADERAWKLVSERDGIQVYMAHNDESRIKTFRGVMELEVDDYNSLPAIADDYDYYGRWLYLISDLRELRRRSPIDRDVVVHTRLPWPVADRDVGLQMLIHQDPKTGELSYDLKGRPNILPVNPDYVRIPEFTGHFKSTPIGGKKVRIDFEVLLDPGGYIPAFLANFILKDIPYQSLQRFRRIINTDQFKGRQVEYLTVPEPWSSQPATH